MGFFRVPNLTTTEGRPMPKKDLKLLTTSVCVTMILVLVGMRFVPDKSLYAWGLLTLISLGCLMSTARVIEDSRKRCKL